MGRSRGANSTSTIRRLFGHVTKSNNVKTLNIANYVRVTVETKDVAHFYVFRRIRPF